MRGRGTAAAKIGVVLVNYGGEQDTLQCLDSLRAQVGVDLNAIVVDNTPADNMSRHSIAYPEMTLLRRGRNLGFAAGTNVGIQHALAADCDSLFLVNNDTVMDSDCLALLLECSLSHPEAAIIAPAIYRESDRNSPWFTGSSLDWATAAAIHETRDVKALGMETPFAIPWATGCAMLIPSRAIRELGGFDERYFCYYEDVDLSLRAADKGYSCLLCPRAVLYHKVGASVVKHGQIQSYYDTRNRFLCFSTHSSDSIREPAMRSLRRLAFKTARRSLLKANWPEERRKAMAVILGAYDFHRRRFGECPYSFV